MLVIDFNVKNMFYSDHSLCQLNLSTDISSIVNQVKRPQSKFILKRNDSSKWDDYRKALSIVQWDTILLSKEVNSLSNNFITTLFQSLVAADILCSVSTKSVSNTYKNQWFSEECYDAKREVKNLLMLCKKNNFSRESLPLFLEAKKYYRNLIRTAKSNYVLKIQSSFRDTRSSKEFWQTIQKFRGKKTYMNEISISDWSNFYNSIYPLEL